MMRTWAISLFLLLASGIAVADPAPTRVALVDTGGDPHVRDIRDLAEIELINDGHIRVLERQQISRLLAEGVLSQTALVDAERAVQIGKLLSAEVLAVLDSSPGSAEAGLVIFDARTGVRLCDRAIVLHDGASDAAAIVKAIVSAVDHRTAAKTLKTVCLSTVRNGDLPRDMDGFCDALGRMLERSILASGSVAVLERSRLDQVTRERALAADATADGILGSTIMIDLDISAAGAGLRATALLTNRADGGTRNVSVTSRGRDGADLIRRLSTALEGALAVPDGPAIDAAAESCRFCREAIFRGSHGDWLHAIAPAEAAHALAPRSALDDAVLDEALIRWGGQNFMESHFGSPAMIRPLSRDAMPALARGAQMLADSAREAREDAPASTEAGAHLEQVTQSLCDFLLTRSSIQRMRPNAKNSDEADLALAREGLRRHLLARNAANAVAAATDHDAFVNYSRDVSRFVDQAEWVCSADARQWTMDHQLVAEQWLALYAKYPGDRSQWVLAALDALAAGWAFERHNYDGVHNFLKINDHEKDLCHWPLTVNDQSRLQWFAATCAAEKDPLLRHYARLAELTLDVVKAQQSGVDPRPKVTQYLQAIKKECRDPGFAGDPHWQPTYYDLLLEAGELLDKTSSASETSEDLMDFMLSQHVVHTPTVDWALDGFHCRLRKPENVKDRTAALEKILGVIDLPDSVVLNVSKETYRGRCAELLERLRHPDQGPPGYALSKPWSAARTLVDVYNAESGFQWVARPVVRDGVVYATGISEERLRGPETIRLLRFPLAGGEQAASPSLPVHFMLQRPDKKHRAGMTMFSGQSACVGEENYFLGTQRDGVLIFPLNGSTPAVLDEQRGLPSNLVQSMAVMKGHLYAAVGRPGKESYLISYDLKQHSCDVLASTQRKEKRSPFDDSELYKFAGTRADAERDRIIVGVLGKPSVPPIAGLWEYKPSTGGWRMLLPMRSMIAFIPTESHGSLPIVANHGLYLFNLVRDEISYLYQMHPQAGKLTVEGALPRMEGESDLAEKALIEREYAFAETWAVTDECVWAGLGRQPWGRVNLATGVSEYCVSPRDGVSPFVPFTLQTIDNGQRLLVGDDDGLWLLTVSPTSTPAQ